VQECHADVTVTATAREQEQASTRSKKSPTPPSRFSFEGYGKTKSGATQTPAAGVLFSGVEAMLSCLFIHSSVDLLKAIAVNYRLFALFQEMKFSAPLTPPAISLYIGNRKELLLWLMRQAVVAIEVALNDSKGNANISTITTGFDELIDADGNNLVHHIVSKNDADFFNRLREEQESCSSSNRLHLDHLLGQSNKFGLKPIVVAARLGNVNIIWAFVLAQTGFASNESGHATLNHSKDPWDIKTAMDIAAQRPSFLAALCALAPELDPNNSSTKLSGGINQSGSLTSRTSTMFEFFKSKSGKL